MAGVVSILSLLSSYGDSNYFDFVVLIALFICMWLVRSDKNILGTLIIYGTAHILWEIAYSVSEALPQIYSALGSYVLVAAFLFKFKKSFLRLSTGTLLAITVSVEIYWFVTGYDSPEIYWHFTNILLVYSMQLALAVRPFLKVNCLNIKLSLGTSFNDLDWQIIKLVNFIVIIQIVVTVEYLARHTLGVPIYFFYYLYEYLMQAINLFALFFILNASFNYRSAEELKA
jgi:hypothetical protein